jgi:hypothetical protein
MQAGSTSATPRLCATSPRRERIFAARTGDTRTFWLSRNAPPAVVHLPGQERRRRRVLFLDFTTLVQAS